MNSYDKIARDYAKLSADLENRTRSYFYSLFLEQIKGKSLLDVGCGSGRDVEIYAKSGSQVYGIDLSERQIELAIQKKCGVFTVGNMNELPYASNVFDVIVSYYALQISTDVSGALREMTRVAKQGGVVVILTKHPITNLLEGYVNDGHLDYYSKRRVTSFIFEKSIKLFEPGHTMMEYIHPLLNENIKIELFEEHTDFPASDQVIPGLIYPTYMIIKYRKI